jgi:hypothetical protein
MASANILDSTAMVAVERVNVVEADIGHLVVLAEVRLDVQPQQVAVFAGGAGALLR